MIIRGPRPQRDFTILDNATIRDDRLTFKARGLLGFILSQPTGYEVTVENLAGEGPEGRDAVRSALSEMERAGYLSRRRNRQEDGTFAWESVVYDRPQTGIATTEIPSPSAGQPSLENPPMVPPAETAEVAGQPINGKPIVGKPVVNRRTEGLEELEGLTDSATRRKSVPAHRIPDDFGLSSAMRDWAFVNCPLVDPDQELANFVDYWVGAGKTKANWEATWRTWMRRVQKDAERYPSRPARNGHAPNARISTNNDYDLDVKL